MLRKLIGRLMLPLLAALMTPEMMRSMLKHFGPIVLKVIQKRLEAGKPFPTEAELQEELDGHVDEFEAEGEEWIRTHPRR